MAGTPHQSQRAYGRQAPEAFRSADRQKRVTGPTGDLQDGHRTTTMRPSQKSNRARGRGGRKPNGGNNINRVYESAGPEGKVRGTPQQIIDKYLSLARDAQTSGDRVVAENFLQHAEHYQRILVEAMGARQERREAQAGEGDQPDVVETESGTDEAAAASRSPSPSPSPAQGQDGDPRRGNGRSRRGAEVRGLTTIDSGDGDAGSLLVEAEDLSASQPKRRRRPGQPKPQDDEAGPSGAETQAEPQPK